MEDNTSCVVLGKSGKSRAWELHCITKSKSNAWRMAHAIEQEQRSLGERYTGIVALLEDYDKGKIKAIKPPKGFNFDFETITFEDLKQISLKQESSKESGFKLKICPYCQAEVPTNGAAQFSHLKKHINELVSKGVLDEKQAKSIRSVKLSVKMRKVFKGVFQRNGG